jgi:NTP pyrophosphatase (non-canonical NTP hydrolase)
MNSDKPINLAGLQSTVDQWVTSIGVRYFDPMTNTAILMEEVGEVARLMSRMYGEQSFKTPTSLEDAREMLSDEMADVLFVLTCLANQCGVDLQAAFEQNMHKKTTRDANRHKENTKLL